jgi:ectoine hydroxylase-related dioxygenase (phytanoyl-CoA dioxygenase family)
MSNWKVTWHQDLSIAVREQCVVPGYGPWSKKAGMIHVQPPVQILENILAVRLHLDNCGIENGPVRVISGSHFSGKLDPASIEKWCRDNPAHDCLVPKGGALLMRPLILHASSSALRPEHRRVIHLEYTASHLPDGLEWITP